MFNFSPFEVIMLLSFGAAWPVSIYKSIRSKTNKGKSIIFLWIIVLGYTMGVLHKITYHHDFVMYLYAFNGCMVLVDIGFYFRNIRYDKVREGGT